MTPIQTTNAMAKLNFPAIPFHLVRASVQTRCPFRQRASVVALLSLILLTGCQKGLHLGDLSVDFADANPDVPVASGNASEPHPSDLLPTIHECVMTPEGLRLKVITTTQDVHCFTSPGQEQLVSHNLGLFQELFVLDLGPNRHAPQWYLVSRSPQKAHQLGYIPASQLAPWPTRMGLRPVAPVLFFAERAHAEQMAREGHSSAPPMGRAEADDQGTFLPWPIIEHVSVSDERGEPSEVVRVNFLGEHRGEHLATPGAQPTNGYDASPTSDRQATIVAGVNMLTVAFCVDNTLSTDPFVSQIIAFIEGASEKLHDHRPNLRLAMTLYRDDVPGLRWDDGVTRTLWDGVPRKIAPFLEGVRPIRAPEVGSIDWPECGYQGLLATLTNTKWDALSQKTIVWISDNSAHPHGSHKNPDVQPKAIMSLARDMGVTIHSVCIEGGGGAAEQAFHRQQCLEIAEGTGGRLYSLHDVQGIAEEIASAVRTESKELESNREDLHRITRGELAVEEYLDSGNHLELRRRYRFVRLLRSAGVELSELAPGMPTFSEGWVATRLPDGTPMFERMVYVSRVELDVLLSELNYLVAVLRTQETQGVMKMFLSGIASRVGDDSFFSRQQPSNVPLDMFLVARQIPLRSGITMKSRDQLLAMSSEEKQALKARLVGDLIPKLTLARGSDAFSLRGDIDFGWIPEAILP